MFNIIKLILILILILIIIIICLQKPDNIKMYETFRLDFELKHIEDKPDKLSIKLPLRTIKTSADAIPNITNLSLVNETIDFKDNDIHIIYKKGYEYNPYLIKYLYYNVNLFMKKYIGFAEIVPSTSQRLDTTTPTEQQVSQLYSHIKNKLWPKLQNIKYTDTFNYKGNKIGDFRQFTQLEPTTTNWIHPGSTTLIQNVNKFEVPIDPDDVTNYLTTK
jgi:hypothetical protein